MSALRRTVNEYLGMRRALGFKLKDAGRGLLDFASFMEQRDAAYITCELALSWATQPSHVQPAEHARRLSFVRGLARFAIATDSRTEIPPNGLLPCRPRRARPYLYTDKEICDLLQAASEMPHRYRAGALLSRTFAVLFGLLAVSGMRLSEARNLKLQDVDLEQAVVTVRGAKFGKSRLVPLHTSTRDVLADYMIRRARHWAGRLVSDYLFLSSRGNRLDNAQVHRAFYWASRRIGLRGASASHGPRLHDLRHRFALQTLLRWYRAGDDAERLLPVLSTYLGHVKISDTYWYLSHWPELMRHAMNRLEQYWGQRT